jgi:hypothetical protein
MLIIQQQYYQLSDLPTQIFPEIQIYGDLSNGRTEIDSDLAFGFIKMGVTPIYRSDEENG